MSEISAERGGFAQSVDRAVAQFRAWRRRFDTKNEYAEWERWFTVGSGKLRSSMARHESMVSSMHGLGGCRCRRGR